MTITNLLRLNLRHAPITNILLKTMPANHLTEYNAPLSESLLQTIDGLIKLINQLLTPTDFETCRLSYVDVF